MATGSDKDEALDAARVDTTSGKGESAGIPAAGELEGSSYNPLGRPGVKHWQTSFVSTPGLEQRGNIYFAAVEMTRMPMLVTDANQPDNPVVFANRAFLDMSGYTEEEVLGRNCRFLQGPESDPATIAELRSAVADKRAVAVDILNYKADGTPFWNALFCGPVFDADGQLLYWFSSQMDITQRRFSEQSFRQAQKMEAIGQLTAGLAHDFNNLLHVISGNLDLATLHAGNNRPLREAIQRATAATQRGGNLTQQLLAFARKQHLEPRQVNLNSQVLEFSDMLSRSLGSQIEVQLDLRPGLPTCTLDPTQLEMALLNVVINARDAMPSGGRVVVATSMLQESERIEAHRLPADATYAVICIIDEGTGMTEEVRQRATEPFFTTKGPGTGLGLAMVHGFVQQSHGRLEVESEPGRGTTVRMIFPATGEAAHASPEPSEQAAEGSGQTILLVDDSEDVRLVAEAYLRSLGYKVATAGSGEQALHLLETGPAVDLLFTDVIMPGGMNGLQLAEQVQQRYGGLPVLLTTGYAEEIQAGENGRSLPVLLKPYRRSDLAEHVRRVLQKSGAAVPNASRFAHQDGDR